MSDSDSVSQSSTLYRGVNNEERHGIVGSLVFTIAGRTLCEPYLSSAELWHPLQLNSSSFLWTSPLFNGETAHSKDSICRCVEITVAREFFWRNNKSIARRNVWKERYIMSIFVWKYTCMNRLCHRQSWEKSQCWKKLENID